MSKKALYTLGGLTFTGETRLINEIVSEYDYAWTEMERIGLADTLQSLGPKGRTLSFTGMTFSMLGAISGKPAGISQIAELAELAEEGIPLQLVDGIGRNLGLWAITKLSENKTDFLQNGAQLTSTWSMSLKRFVVDSTGGDGVVASGAFDIVKWRTQIASYLNKLSSFLK